MLNRIAAEVVMLFHFAFVLFGVLGGLLGLADPRLLWLHAPVIVWSSVVNLFAWTCPLTPLEKRLRVAAGGDGYTGGFITHYVGPLVYPGGMPRKLELTAAVSIVVWNALVYAVVFVFAS